MNDFTLHAENEPYSARPQHLSDDSQSEQNLIEQDHDREDVNCHEKERSSDILKKYLECMKTTSWKKRRRCISQELG